MSPIDDLKVEYCPDRVEFKRLGDIVRIRNGKDHKSLGDGEVPVYGSGGIMRYADTYAYNKPSVLIPRKGSLGNLFFVDVPFWTVDTIFYTEIDNAQVNPKYLYYFLTTVGLGKMNQAGGVPSQTQSVLNELKIPIPCPDNPEKSLAIQAEIVRILDAFTALTAELTAELNMRKKQYNYYRDQLLSFEEGDVEWKTLGELAQNLDSKRKPITSGLREAGDIPYYGASGIVDYVKDYIFDGDYLLVSEDGANLLARNTPIAFSISGKTWVNNHAHVLKFETYAERKYVEYYLNSIDLTPYISGAAQPKLNKKNLESIKIPNPVTKEKERIVATLDKFDALTCSIKEGLPREIELRQKQYEYYRDLLLSFPKPNAEVAV
ncbi:restriction modification system DNA specificity domain-containing protein [Shewanella sairae]|uniref:Restriction modification system DNA specificity domain-containing protein n=1 Tax=Shewanella sairae TaxID=190310 RepID=A0ABQ4PRG6_9GAMM|nr:restriction endonuclease subunit S [Shewanella sairae]MCL1132404.1 restriction endonuclease subunit S [Shewanella sairae]GIU51761.1 restriction modification system DNA specificity domain-containing protein [Shewanella sairae]